MTASSEFNGTGTEHKPRFTIFLDLDGVVADFNTHVDAQDKRKADGWVDYKALDTPWWISMPAFDGAKAFYEDLRTRAPVKILTATPPTSLDAAHSGKAKWVLDFVKRGSHAMKDLIICPAADKPLLSGHARILIDDSAKNIDAWKQAGGIGILHKGDFADTLKRLDAEMTRMTQSYNVRIDPGNVSRGPV